MDKRPVHVYLVTCAQSTPLTNPGLTEAGFCTAERLQVFLPAGLPAIHGASNRHKDMAIALRLVRSSPSVRSEIVLGTTNPEEVFSKSGIERMLSCLAADTVICTDAAAVATLGVPNVRPATVYCATVLCGEVKGIEPCTTPYQLAA